MQQTQPDQGSVSAVRAARGERLLQALHRLDAAVLDAETLHHRAGPLRVSESTIHARELVVRLRHVGFQACGFLEARAGGVPVAVPGVQRAELIVRLRELGVGLDCGPVRRDGCRGGSPSRVDQPEHVVRDGMIGTRFRDERIRRPRRVVRATSVLRVGAPQARGHVRRIEFERGIVGGHRFGQPAAFRLRDRHLDPSLGVRRRGALGHA